MDGRKAVVVGLDGAEGKRDSASEVLGEEAVAAVTSSGLSIRANWLAWLIGGGDIASESGNLGHDNTEPIARPKLD
jgi:hypothetical protein